MRGEEADGSRRRQQRRQAAAAGSGRQAGASDACGACKASTDTLRCIHHSAS